jgi:hypothetical protein
MDVGNVTTVTQPDGDIFGYACQSGRLQKYHLTFSNQGGVNSRINLPNDGPDGSCSVAAVLGLDAEGAPERHVFYRQKGNNSIWYLLDDPAAEDQTYTGTPFPVRSSVIGTPAFPGSFGAVSNSDGVILVGFTDKAAHPSITIVTIPWDGLLSNSWLAGASAVTHDLVDEIADPTLAGHTVDRHDCDLDCTLVTQPGTGNQVLIWVARMKDKSGMSYLHVFCSRVGAGLSVDGAWGLSSSGSQSSSGRVVPLNWDPANPVAESGSIQSPKITCRPDNTLELTYLDKYWQARALGLLLGDFFDVTADGGSAAGRSWAPQTDIDVIPKMSKGQKVSNVDYGNNAFEVAFVSGAPETSQSANNPDLTDVAIPLYPAVIYWSRGNLWHLTSQSLWAYIARRGLPSVRGNQVLLGIIEGPPPVPEENLNLDPHWDPYMWMGQPGFAAASFATTQSESVGVNLGWSAGIIASASVKYEADANFWIFESDGYLKGSLELQLAYRGTYESLSSQALWQGNSTRAEMAQDPTTKAYSIQAAGSLVLMDASWTGYQYVVLDSGGNAIPTATTVHQLYPTHVEIAAVPYLIPPPSDGTPVPGRLMSYVLPPDEEQALQDGSVIQMQGGVKYLTNSWGYNTKTVSNFTTTSQSRWSHGLTFDLKALVTAGGALTLLGQSVEAEITAGIQVKFEATWSWATQSSKTVGVDVDLRGNSAAPDSYTYYVFYLYLLAEDNDWCQDLLPRLLTDTWPTDPNQRAQQQQLVQMISPDSAPWKICYAVDPQKFHFNQAATEVLAASDELDPLIQDRFQAAGITTTQHIRGLLGAADAARTSGDVAAATGPLTRETGGDPAAVQELARQIMASEALTQELSDGLARLQAQHRAGLGVPTPEANPAGVS